MTNARPIIFSGPMVRAILDGRKTQTRRIIKPQPGSVCGHDNEEVWHPVVNRVIPCPFGVPSDRLWVREAFCEIGPARPSGYWTNPALKGKDYWYHADNDKPTWGGRWKSPIHMPRVASRLTLEVTAVRVQRVQDISEADAKAEGVQTHAQFYGQPEQKHLGTTPWYRYDGAACAATSARHSFETLWGSINGPDSWAESPWVWAVTFRIALASGGEANVSGDRLRGEGRGT